MATASRSKNMSNFTKDKFRLAVLLKIAVCLVMLLGLPGPGLLKGQTNVTFQYTYDENNELIGAQDSTGNTVTYSYDAVGNLVRITRSSAAAGSVSILSMTPTQGAVGATVDIQGQGFSST